jgi:hypothetical protein
MSVKLKMKKGGMKFKKKSSLKLLSHSQPNFAEMILAVGAILVEGPNRRTHFWKRTIQ